MSEILVKKRNGKSEPFSADKTNKVIKWACEGVQGVVENEIAGAFHTNIRNGISTKEIHKGLIDAAVGLINETNPNYEIAAANLLNYELRKRVWKGKDAPDFYSFIVENTKNKRYTDEILQWYSKEEIDDFGKYIKHDRDFNFKYSGLSQVIDKYLIKTLPDKKVYETPQIAYMLIAMVLFHDDKSYVKEIYDSFSNFDISLPTPVFAGVRTNLKSFASCLLLDMGDSVDEICSGFEVIAKATSKRFGIGVNMTKMRPIGAPIRGGENIHTGKVGFLRTIQDTIKTWLQGCYDDKTEVLTENGWKFFDKLSKDELVAQVSDENTVSFVKPTEYFKYLVDEDLVSFKDSKNIDLLVTKNHNMVYKTNDRIHNRRLNGKHLTNKRVVSDKFKIKDAENMPLHADIVFQNSSFAPTGNGLSWEDKFKIALQADGHIRKRNNNVYTFHFSKTRKIDRLDEILSNLNLVYKKYTCGDGTIQFSVYGGENKYSKVFDWVKIDTISKEWANEFILELLEWDGSKRKGSKCNGNYSTTVYENANVTQAVASLCGYKSSLSVTEKPNEPNKKTIYSVYFSLGQDFGGDHVKKELVKYKGYVYCVEVPSNKLIVRRSGRTVVCGNSTRSGAATVTVPIWDYEIEEILQLKDPMRLPENRVGDIDYSISISKLFYNRWARNETITLFNAHEVPELERSFGLPEFDELYLKAEANTKLKFRKVVNMRDLGDLFQKNGIESGRYYITNIDHANSHSSFTDRIGFFNLCQEIGHPVFPMKSLNDPDGLLGICILLASNAINLKSDEKHQRICELSVRTLDKLIDYQDYFCIPAENFSTKFRSLGIGMTNFAALLAKKGLKYSSQEAKDYANELFEKNQFYLIEASIKLAKEKGPCEWLSRTKYGQGILPIDTYAKSVDTFVSPKLLMDWESLREDLLKYGIRHATLSAYMPCEASSLVTNSTNGLERPRSKFVSKGNKSKDLPAIVPNFKKWTYEYAFDNPSNEDHIKMMAIVQKYCDMSISTNFYYNYNHYEDGQIPLKVLNKDIFDAYRYGLKTIYYRNSEDGNNHNLSDSKQESCQSGACSI